MALTGNWLVQAEAADYSGSDCLIEPNAAVDVTTPEEGVIEEVAVQRGGTIKKGLVLARLESTVEKVAVDIACAREKNAVRCGFSEIQGCLSEGAKGPHRYAF
jgi:hypothetical protein